MFNRKGVLQVQVVFGALAVIMGLAAAALRPSHIERSYVKKCVYQGGSVEECTVKCEALTQAEQLEFVKDTVENPTYHE